ncbi:MAG: hypothetical protein ACREYE_17545 [Gammaproteobacteria bacterium]
MIEPPGVRERLQHQYGLKVLRLYMDSSEGRDHVMFSFSLQDGEEAALLTASAEEIGLPHGPDAASCERRELQEAAFRIPEYINSALAHLCRESELPGATLWIRLATPLGLLTAVPWERLLQPALGVPVLRLPYHVIAPRTPERELDLVICFSAPIAKPELQRNLIDSFIEQIPLDLAKSANLHLFADLAVYRELLEVKRQYGGEYRINVYNPQEASTLGKHAGENPWLAWMRTALGGRSADVVHFLCHCYSVRDEGALALAESPGRNENLEGATLVSAEKVAEFLNATGAWSLAFTSPPSNVSAVGMRMLQDCVARRRPGPVLMHDMAHPDSCRALGAAYRFLYTAEQPAPASPAISLHCHPFREAGVAPDDQSDRLLDQFTLAGKLGDRLKNSSQPVWLAASQRILEATAGDLAAAVEADPDSGRKRARDFVLDALTEYANPEDVEG